MRIVYNLWCCCGGSGLVKLALDSSRTQSLYLGHLSERRYGSCKMCKITWMIIKCITVNAQPLLLEQKKKKLAAANAIVSCALASCLSQPPRHMDINTLSGLQLSLWLVKGVGRSLLSNPWTIFSSPFFSRQTSVTSCCHLSIVFCL